MKKIALFAAAFLGCLTLGAQTTVETVSVVSEYSVSKPVMFDSVDNNSKAFDAFCLLDFVAADTKNSIEKTADPQGFFAFSCNENSNKLVRLGFRLSVSGRTKVKFSIVSDCALKADFANGTKEKRSAEEDTLFFETEYNIGVYDLSLALLADKDCRVKIMYEGENACVKPVSDKKELSLEFMLTGRHLYNVALSPSGEYYVLQYYDTDASGANKWAWDLKRSGSNELLYSSTEHFDAAWLPKSDMLYYSDRTNGTNSLVVLDPKTLETTVLADAIPEGSVRFLPNEQAFVISVKQKYEKTDGDLKRLLSPEDRAEPDWRNRTDLWLYRLGEKALQRLTFSSSNVALYDVSRDSRRLLISVSKEDYTKRPFFFSTFYELDLETLKLDSLFTDGFVADANYFGDSIILFTASAEAFGGIGARVKKNQTPSIYNNLLFTYDRHSRKVQAPLADFSPSINGVIVKGEKVFLQTTDRDSVNVYLYQPNQENKVERLNLCCEVVGSFSTDAGGDFVLFVGQSYNKADCLFEMRGADCKEVYYPRKKDYETVALGQMQQWNHKTKNGIIEGRFYLPTDFSPEKKYPVIVYYYGGCTPSDRTFVSRYNPYLYAARGYIVYVLNPSGCIGYGQEFAARHVNAWGKQTADDITECVKAFCKEHAFVDSEHIGCMGASYGGFITQYLVSHSDLFAAAVSHAGISNITSYWGEGYWGYSYSAAASANSYPWNAKEMYTNQSPLFSADKINTPLLLLHGTSDTNVPIGESIQMYNALKLLGKTVEFVSVKGENHGIMDYKKRLAWNNSIYAWFDKWLKGESGMWDEMYPKTNLEK